MGRHQSRDGEERFSRAISMSLQCDRAAVARRADARLLHGSASAVRAEERRADRSGRRRLSVSRRNTSRCCISWPKALVGRGRAGQVREMVLPAIERHGAIEAWIIDDTAFPSTVSIRLACRISIAARLGKQENCQVVVSLSLANHYASLPVAYRLYFPKSWAEDRKRRTKAGVPDDIDFQTKPKIALDQLEWACAAGLPRGVVLMDRPMGPTPPCVAAHASSVSTIRPPFTPERWSRVERAIRQDDGQALALDCRNERGGRSHGAKAQPSHCARASHVCGCVLAARAARPTSPRNGC